MNVRQEDASGPETVEKGFLPDFCSLRNLLLVVVSAELLAMVLSLSAEATTGGFIQTLSLRSLYIQWIALSGVALICTLRPWLQRLPDALAGFLAWLLLQSVTLMIGGFALYLLDSHMPNFHGTPLERWPFLFRSLGISAIVCALVLRYLYMQHLWRQQLVAESQAKLQALQSRIRPHFLFNSMNTIASLTRSRPEMAEEIVHDLADLFRASLQEVSQLSTLGDELELVRGYLRIEGQRLGPRLQVEWDVGEVPEEAAIPPLILQPLVENAVYHGIEPSTKAGKIRITGRYRRHLVNLSIRNSLPPAGTKSQREGNRMALDNIRQRLAGAFDNMARLTVSEVDGDYQVRMVFPHPWRLG